MKILSIDTSQKFTYLTLQNDNEIQTYISDSFIPHSKTLMISLDNILKKCNVEVKDLDAISVVVGPGSFTGCRLGISIAKGLAYPYNIKLISISSLELLQYSSALDLAVIKGIGKELFLIDKQKMSLTNLDDFIVGYGQMNVATYSSDNLNIEKALKIEYDIQNLAQLSKIKFEKNQFIDIKSLSPIYLRESQAELELKRKLYGEN